MNRFHPKSELNSDRGRFFFWIGMMLLPIFWLWWMHPSLFSKRAIRLGRYWTALWSVGVLLGWIFVGTHIAHAWDPQGLAVRMTGILVGWLLLRIYGLWNLLVFCLVTIDITATIAPIVASSLKGLNFGGWIYLFPLIAAALHLLPWHSTRPELAPGEQDMGGNRR
jgi:hypothetical protein